MLPLEETIRAAIPAQSWRKAQVFGRGAGPLRRRADARRRRGRPPRRRGLAHARLGQEPDHGVLRRAGDPRAGNGKPDDRRLTDRNDLDDQLFGTFARCHELLRQPPVQAADRADLRAKLSVASGGVVFTTIQKFFPEEKGDRHPVLSERRNIVVIADEAHRSQYDFIDGFARHMRDALPNASFIGFTGTPIEKTDANTRAVFGDYISIYDIQRAVADGATVPIYYESRLAKLELKASERPKIDPRIRGGDRRRGGRAQGKAQERNGRSLKPSSARRAGSSSLPSDLVEHFENRLSAMDGKAMVVVMSRRIAVALYKEIVALRPDWHSDDDDKGSLKIVMTGSASDPLEWQDHIRNKPRREKLANRFRDANDPFKIVIVRDMWLTGFDAPSLHTMYVDKPMRGHGLMQAIARVNRVFKDKPGGLVVDYLGLADELRQALATYTEVGRHRTNGDRSGGSRRGHAGEIRNLLRRCSTASTGRGGLTGTPAQSLSLLPGGARTYSRARGRQAARFCMPLPTCRRPLRLRFRTTRRSAFAMMSASSRPCGPIWRRARRAIANQMRTSIMPSGRSFPRPWSPTKSSTFLPPPV